jgi:hypothetical protein
MISEKSDGTLARRECVLCKYRMYKSLSEAKRKAELAEYFRVYKELEEKEETYLAKCFEKKGW